jgi:DNA-binding phage protein
MVESKAFEDLKKRLLMYDLDTVARTSKVNKQTLNNWLNGTTKGPRLTTLIKVSKALGYKLVFQRSTTRLRLVG